MIVRPVRSSDLPALIDLARSTGTGLTTLPANEERLTHRVGWAEKTFRGEAGRGAVTAQAAALAAENVGRESVGGHARLVRRERRDDKGTCVR